MIDNPSIFGSAVKANPSTVSRPRNLADALEEVAHALVVEHIAEREHRHGVHDLAEGLDRGGANAGRRAVLADEMREARLDGGVAFAQRVIVGVGDLRLILPVIERVVMGDLAGETLKLGGSFGLAQAIDGRWHGRLRLSPTLRFAHAGLCGSCRPRHQPLGRGAGLVGDGLAGKHAGNLLAPALAV